MKKVGVISLGCSKNTVDTEMMLGNLVQQGYSSTNMPEDANVLIINTCGFIDSAKKESVDTILEMAEYKNNGVCEKLIVMGCLSQRYSKELNEQIPEIDFIVGAGDIPTISKLLSDDVGLIDKKDYVTEPYFAYENEEYKDNTRILTTPSHTAYLKIAEGCSAKCSFCIIPQLRGPYVSRPIESIIKEATFLAGKGIKEINLIAQDTTVYGADIGIKNGLPKLLEKIVNVKGFEWIRLLYSHSPYITESLIAVINKYGSICKYIDIPIQHSHDEVLKKMNRPEREVKIRNMVRRLRADVPDIVLRTTCIVGFPGEKEEHFEHLCKFIKEIKFDRLGVFTYSKEEGTLAADLQDNVSEEIKKERYQTIMGIQQEISRTKNEEKIGRVFPVLVEELVSEGRYSAVGRLSTQAPEIDGSVFINDYEAETGNIINVKITDALDYDLIGRVVVNS